MKKTFQNTTLIVLTFLFSLFALVMTIKSTVANPKYYQEEYSTHVGGPFEASNSTARYALTEAIVENNTFFLEESKAKFAAPDVVDYKGKYMSIFTPGISFLAVPFYMIGAVFGYTQIGTYFLNIVFALLNVFLVAKLARKFGANNGFALLSGFAFLVATNSISYAQTLTQHQVSASVILLIVLNSFANRNLLNNFTLGFLFAFGTVVDIPNAMMLIPLVFMVLSKHFDIKKLKEKVNFNINLSFVFMALGLIPVLAIFAWYNFQTTGSYTLLAQNIGRSDLFKEGLPANISDKNKKDDIEFDSGSEINIPFDTRKELNSLYILLVSNERSWIFYSPVVLLGLVALGFLYKKEETRFQTSLIISVFLTNIFVYSLFGDPWGGWAFGPRYLIPSTALIMGLLGAYLSGVKGKSKYLLLALFLVLYIYSVYVNTLGAITTSSIAPRVEAINLPEPIPYTYQYNTNLLNEGRVGSLIYNMLLATKITPTQFLWLLATPSVLFGMTLYIAGLLQQKKNE